MRARIFRVAYACVAVLLVGLGAARLSIAQPTPAPPPTPSDVDNVGFQLPPFAIPDTDFAFFNFGVAVIALKEWFAANDAVKICDEREFEAAKRSLENMLRSAQRVLGETVAAFPTSGRTAAENESIKRRMEVDIDALRRMLEAMGTFDKRCPQKKAIDDLMEFFLHGGVSLPYLLSGNIGALEGGGGGGDRSFGTSSRLTGLLGGGVRVNVLRVNPTFFVEARFQTAFGAASFSQTVPGLGENVARENWGIPLLLGITVPLGTLGTLPLGADFYGGITIANWTHSLPGADQTRTTIDPTFGAALRMRAFDLNGDGRPDLILGLHGEVSFRQADTATTQGFSGTIDAHPNVQIMLRVGIPFGKGPLIKAD